MEPFRLYFYSTNPAKDKFIRLTFGISGILYFSIGIALYYSKTVFSDNILWPMTGGIAYILYALGSFSAIILN